MTVPQDISRVSYTGANTTDTFTFTNVELQDDDDVAVIVKLTSSGLETTLTKTTHYTVSNTGVTTGATIALVNGSFAWLDADGDLATGYTMTLLRAPAFTQETSIKNQSAFLPETHEDALDRAAMRDQYQEDWLKRALRIPPGENPATYSMELPVALSRASSALGFDSTGNLTTSSAFTGSLTPTVTSVTITGLTASRLVSTDASKVLASVGNLASWVAGTTNQLTVTDDADGSITLSTPQNTHTAASPTFTGATFSGLTASGLVATDGSKALTSTVSGLSPTMTGLNLSGLTASALVATDGSKNLSSSVTGLSPTFTGLTLSGLTNDRIVYSVSDVLTSGFYYNGTSVGIGTTGPDRTLDVLNASNPQIRVTHTDGTVYVDLQADSTGHYHIIPSNTSPQVSIRHVGSAGVPDEAHLYIYGGYQNASTHHHLNLECESDATTNGTCYVTTGQGTYGAAPALVIGTGSGGTAAITFNIGGISAWTIDTAGALKQTGGYASTLGTSGLPCANVFSDAVNTATLNKTSATLTISTTTSGDISLSPAGSISIVDGKNIALQTTTGTKIGTATTQKLAFYNSTPIVQGAAVADASGGATVDAEARTAINALLARIRSTGLIAT